MWIHICVLNNIFIVRWMRCILLYLYLNYCHHLLFALDLTLYYIQNVNFNIQNYKSYFLK
jgi:hypothetical protein